MQSSPSNKVSVGFCGLSQKKIWENEEYFISAFTSIESLSFLKGWSSPVLRASARSLWTIDARGKLQTSCIWPNLSSESHLQGSSHPTKSGRTESCTMSHWGPFITARQISGCCPPHSLSVPPCPLTSFAHDLGHTQDLVHPDHVQLNLQISASSHTRVHCTLLGKMSSL